MYTIERQGNKYHFIIVSWNKDEKEDLQDNHKRTSLSDSSFPLQVALIAANRGKVYPAHYHIPTVHKVSFGTQELWYIISGIVEVDFFDTDGEFIDRYTLREGELVITYLGGHRYSIIEDNTKVIEVKSGPYYGKELDKVIIN